MASLQSIGRPPIQSRTVASSWLALLSFLFLFLFACLAEDPAELRPSSVALGSFLPPDGDTNNVVLKSPNSMFNLNVETWRSSPAVYCMAGISNVKINPDAMLWAANNAQPIQVASSCRLYLSEEGDLLLLYDGNNTAWRTHTTGMGVSNLTLLDSGNLVLLTEQGFIAWQSFAQSPAFAFYQGMNLTSNVTIFSSVPIADGVSNFNIPGSFAMQLDNHSNLILFTNTNESSSRFVYWSTSISGIGHLNATTEQVSYITLDVDGFTFHDKSTKALGSIPPAINLPSNFSASIKVAIIDPSSANLLAFYRENHNWTLFFNSSITTCENPTHCGNFSLCNASTGACSCPPGFVQGGRDCEPETENALAVNTCTSSAETISYRFVSVNVSFQPQMSAVASLSVENCILLCTQSCMCKAALYDPDTRFCSLFSNLQTVLVKGDSKQLLLLKLPTWHKKHILKIVLEAVCAAIALSLCSVCAIAAIYCFRRKKVKSGKLPASEEHFLQGLPRLPPKYTYKELDTATEGFSTKLGAGAFGAVYEGVLPSGEKVAVKKLEDGGEQSMVQFRAEVASIGSVSHMNLVTLKGFCHGPEGRLLVYEYMGMGSLDRWLFKEGEEVNKLGWKRRCKIAIDTAKGLAYLHHECGERIVHCDVKPENILLDEQFDAKVGDFGLAKLVGKERQSFAITTLKGTRGYLAPEWLQDATITAKSDVYSFGVVLLELISGRRCLDSDYGYLPTLAFRIVSTSATLSSCNALSTSLPAHRPQEGSGKQENIDDMNSLSASQDVGRAQYSSSSNSYDYTSMKELLDPCLDEDADVTPVSLERTIFTGLWCVQPRPASRPAMNVVVQMLDGVVEVPPPPLQMPSGQAEELSTYISTSMSSTAP